MKPSFIMIRVSTLLLSILCLFNNNIHARILVDEAFDQVSEAIEDLPLGNVAENEELPKGRIFLKNGDKLRGEAIEFNKNNQILFQANKLKKAATFPLQNVLTLKFNKQANNTQIKKVIARVEMNNRFNEPSGDVLLGDLHQVNEGHIILDTEYAGRITIKRSMVKSFKIIHQGSGSYYGPNNIDEWQTIQGNDSWKFQDGSLISNRINDCIGQNISLHSSAHIAFNVKYEKSLQFSTILYSNEPSKKHPKFGYLLSLTDNNANISIIDQKNINKQRFGGRQGASLKTNTIKKSAYIEIFSDTSLGIFTIYIDGKQECSLQTDGLNIDSSNSGISFINNASNKVTLSDISISPWAGDLPKQKLNEGKDKAHHITLKNGDQVPGDIGKVAESHIMIDTEYTPIRIPIERIKSFNLETTEEQPIKKRGDVSLWFHNGGRLTMKLNNMTKEKIKGYGQAFGDIEINTSSLSRLDFDIYNDALQSDRAKIN